MFLLLLLFVNPLPNLRSGNFSRRSVFHFMVKRRRAVASQPAFDIQNADIDIESQACFGYRTFGGLK